MPARLVAIDDGVDIVLDRAMVVVGRHPQCDARLDSLRVSRHHCCMTVDQGTVLVRDLGSTNGIRINGHRVEYGRIQDGDELSIAHIRYRLVNSIPHEATLADPSISRNGYPLKCSMPASNGKAHPIASLSFEKSQDNGNEKGTDPAPDSDLLPHPRPKIEVLAVNEAAGKDGPDSREHFEPLSANQHQALPRIGPKVLKENALAAAVRELLPAEVADRCRIQVIVQMPEVEEAPGAEKLEACLPDSPL